MVEGGYAMSQAKLHNDNIDNSQWLKNFSDFLHTVRAFLGEVFETCKILFKKGLTQTIKEIKFFISKSTLLDFVCGGFIALFGSLAILIFISGFCLIGYQIMLWLIDGVWTGFPLILGFNFLFESTALHSWITNPESLYGLQKVVVWVLENTPISATLIIPGFILTSVSAGIMTGAIMIRYYQFKKAENN